MAKGIWWWIICSAGLRIRPLGKWCNNDTCERKKWRNVPETESHSNKAQVADGIHATFIHQVIFTDWMKLPSEQRASKNPIFVLNPFHGCCQQKATKHYDRSVRGWVWKNSGRWPVTHIHGWYTKFPFQNNLSACNRNKHMQIMYLFISLWFLVK